MFTGTEKYIIKNMPEEKSMMIYKLLVKQIPLEQSTHFKPDPEIFTETVEYDYDILTKTNTRICFFK